jgi:hypothetical protein
MGISFPNDLRINSGVPNRFFLKEGKFLGALGIPFGIAGFVEVEIWIGDHSYGQFCDLRVLSEFLGSIGNLEISALYHCFPFPMDLIC